MAQVMGSLRVRHQEEPSVRAWILEGVHMLFVRACQLSVPEPSVEW